MPNKGRELLHDDMDSKRRDLFREVCPPRHGRVGLRAAAGADRASGRLTSVVRSVLLRQVRADGDDQSQKDVAQDGLERCKRSKFGWRLQIAISQRRPCHGREVERVLL